MNFTMNPGAYLLAVPLMAFLVFAPFQKSHTAETPKIRRRLLPADSIRPIPRFFQP